MPNFFLPDCRAWNLVLRTCSRLGFLVVFIVTRPSTQFQTRTNSALRDYYGRARLLLPRLLKSSLQTSRCDQGKEYFGIFSLGYEAAVLHRFIPTKRWPDAKRVAKALQTSLSTSVRGCDAPSYGWRTRAGHICEWGIASRKFSGIGHRWAKIMGSAQRVSR